MSSEAFIEMIDTHQNIIYKIALTYRDNREDQEDLFQEIVFQLWKARNSFRNEAKISTWIYRVALNTAIAIYRKNKVAMNYQEHIPESLHPSDYQDISEQEERMYQALRQLNDIEKAIVSLYLEDYAYQEIADIMGISENYVGVRINRIKQKLKKILNT
ncbi:MAG TPA: RNA polymerase subunit sigma-70 [Microscillaceae bacterium]|nr:RNA polymerase subunit sigma-70 [Microscillaceae bacterium]